MPPKRLHRDLAVTIIQDVKQIPHIVHMYIQEGHVPLDNRVIQMLDELLVRDGTTIITVHGVEDVFQLALIHLRRPLAFVNLQLCIIGCVGKCLLQKYGCYDPWFSCAVLEATKS